MATDCSSLETNQPNQPKQLNQQTMLDEKQLATVLHCLRMLMMLDDQLQTMLRRLWMPNDDARAAADSFGCLAG